MSLEDMEIERDWDPFILSLAEKLYCTDVAAPHPDGGLQGTHEDSDFVPDPNGRWYKTPSGYWTECNVYGRDKVNRDWPIDPSLNIRGPVWHRDEYKGERRRIRECYRLAELFYSTVEELKK